MSRSGTYMFMSALLQWRLPEIHCVSGRYTRAGVIAAPGQKVVPVDAGPLSAEDTGEPDGPKGLYQYWTQRVCPSDRS